MSSDPSGLIQRPRPSSRVHGDRLADDEAIANEFADGLPRIGVRDFVHFIRIEPDLALSAANNRGSQAFLSSQIDPAVRWPVSKCRTRGAEGEWERHGPMVILVG